MQKDNQRIKVIYIVVIVAALLITFANFYYQFDKHSYSKPTIMKEDFVLQEDDFSTPINDISALVNNEISGVIYFGRDTCPECLTLNIILHELCEENSEITIHKFDTDYWRDNDQFDEVLEKYGVKSIPLLVKVDGDNYSKLSFGAEDQTDLRKILQDFLLPQTT